MSSRVVPACCLTLTSSSENASLMPIPIARSGSQRGGGHSLTFHPCPCAMNAVYIRYGMRAFVVCCSNQNSRDRFVANETGEVPGRVDGAIF
ncbi:hypothetical protein AVEN_24173-1 [Araneus ventricosus]|uniref:Uncharacterized protein n=1 Tax=Araneus ventricosus TaxID=182803 RepID=A0A4Y2HSX7_ARAVE|nr:hypothetical protein AVEN_24173-1 [Araneus ventricosus]